MLIPIRNGKIHIDPKYVNEMSEYKCHYSGAIEYEIKVDGVEFMVSPDDFNTIMNAIMRAKLNVAHAKSTNNKRRRS